MILVTYLLVRSPFRAHRPSFVRGITPLSLPVLKWLAFNYTKKKIPEMRILYPRLII